MPGQDSRSQADYLQVLPDLGFDRITAERVVEMGGGRAYQRPMERRFIAALTVLVISGLVLTEVIAVSSGHLAAWRMVPTWGLQTALLGLFADGYHHTTLRRLIASTSPRLVRPPPIDRTWTTSIPTSTPGSKAL